MLCKLFERFHVPCLSFQSAPTWIPFECFEHSNARHTINDESFLNEKSLLSDKEPIFQRKKKLDQKKTRNFIIVAAYCDRERANIPAIKQPTVSHLPWHIVLTLLPLFFYSFHSPKTINNAFLLATFNVLTWPRPNCTALEYFSAWLHGMNISWCLVFFLPLLLQLKQNRNMIEIQTWKYAFQ